MPFSNLWNRDTYVHTPLNLSLMGSKVYLENLLRLLSCVVNGDMALFPEIA